MEITNNQVKPVTLEGASTPTKVSVVVPEKISVTRAEPTVQSESESNTESLQKAVSQINDHVQNLQRSLLFTVDEESGKDIVTVLDTDTEEVIRQYPSEEVLVIARRLAEQSEDAINLFSSRI